MIIGALMLAGLFFLPMWNITLEAPQYPDPIGFDIYINRFEDSKPNDIKNINIMNHYVGMDEIPETIPEFSLFPYFVIGMIILGVLFGIVGKRKLYVVWFALMLILGSIAIYDFYLWEYDYGHSLDPKAAIKFTDENGEPMAYQPPLIGNKTILNFKALSWPRAGTYVLILGMGLSLYAFYTDKKSGVKGVTAGVLALALLSSCEIKPQEIAYGQDACEFCRMTIVDRQHSAELVTVKGKAFKYDAIECMMNHLDEWDHPEVKYHLVADYSNPGVLIDAKNAHYVITEAIPSPMGRFLSAFESESARDEVVSQHGGQSYDWESLSNLMLAEQR